MSSKAVTAIAMLSAGLLMAHQVAAKAARDAIFLSNFDARALPAMVVGAAICSIALGLLSSRVLSRWTPSRVVPWAFLFSSLLQVFEWHLLAAQPKVAAVLIYLHLVALGAVLLSSFWSLTNELLDPHTAKQRFGQIAGGGTLGGILGGLAAERVAAWFATSSVLLWLAALHLLGALALFGMRNAWGAGAARRLSSPPEGSAWQAFSKAPYLFSVAALVVIGTCSAAAVDWVFKSQAAGYFGRGEPLMRFFALFHTSVAVLTFLVQSFAARASLERFGLGRTVAGLPATVTVGGLSALFFPGFPVITVVRGAEFVMRGSLFRSGYELFYTPIPVAEKRAAKSIIDVGVDRLGDALGAGITQLFLLLNLAAASNRILLTVVALSAAGAVIALRLDRGYVQALEKSLLTRAVELDLSDVQDTTTRSIVSVTLAPVPRVQDLAPGLARAVAAAAPAPARPRSLEPVVQALADLRSGKPDRVHAVFAHTASLDTVLAGQAISLLGWNEVSRAAREALGKIAPHICGQLIDALLDPSQDFAIRRRIPSILASCGGQRVADGLVAGMSDSRFEVRFQCSRALASMLAKGPALTVNREAILAVVDRELSVSRSVWEGRRLLDRSEPSEQTQFLDDLLRERSDASLEHVFTLLGLILPREPLKVVFRALHTDDRQLRGLALEYLESVLPDHVRQKLSRIVEDAPCGEPKRSGDEILASLMQSNQSVVMRLREKLGSS